MDEHRGEPEEGRETCRPGEYSSEEPSEESTKQGAVRERERDGALRHRVRMS